MKIQPGVTSIGYNAFFRCSDMKRIRIPDTVISLGDYAIYECDSLVTIPDSITTINWDVFQGCESLTDITVIASVTEISSCAFFQL